MTPDERLIANAIDAASRIGNFTFTSLLAELPAADAAAYLRERAHRAFTGGPTGYLAMAELDIMVRFYRLCQPAPPALPGRAVTGEKVVDEASRQLVADEVARLRRSRPGGLQSLQADLLEQADVGLAAAFLREAAMRALDARFRGGEVWAVSALLQADVHRELRRAPRREVRTYGEAGT